MPIQPATRIKIKTYLEDFIDKLILKHAHSTIPLFDDPASYLAQTSTKPEFKPFHAAAIPHEIMRISAVERSFSTSLGSSFEESARLIALDYHTEAKLRYDMSGEVSRRSLAAIDNAPVRFENDSELFNGDVDSPLSDLIDDVLDAWDDHTLIPRQIRSDLYILTHDGQELFFEIKSPVPNKGQCVNILRWILSLHLLRRRKRPDVQAYLAMPYNPFGPTRADYNWSVPQLYLPFDETVLIGHEFWELIGGPNTYEELLAIYHEVGQQKSQHIIDVLKLRF
jgi:hypothetical protein